MHGDSSQIPLIGQLLSENFGEIVKYKTDLKRSAALGAIEYYEKTYTPGLIVINLIRQPKLSSSYGIILTAIDGRSKFHELIPFGTKIPTQPAKIDISLRRRMTIAVLKNLGTHEYIKEAPEEFEIVKQFDIKLPDEISDEKIASAEFFIEVNEGLRPKLSIIADDIFKEFF